MQIKIKVFLFIYQGSLSIPYASQVTVSIFIMQYDIQFRCKLKQKYSCPSHMRAKLHYSYPLCNVTYSSDANRNKSVLFKQEPCSTLIRLHFLPGTKKIYISLSRCLSLCYELAVCIELKYKYGYVQIILVFFLWVQVVS